MYIDLLISERLYEFAVNFEEYNKHKNIYIVNQVKEKNLGFDAMFFIQKKNNSIISNLNVKIILLQYKIPIAHNVNQISLNTANFNKIRHQPWSAGNFFRFEIDNSLQNFNTEKVFDQHNQLLDFTQYKNITAYYVAPRFLDTSTLYQYMSNNSVVANSILISFKHLPRLKKMIKPAKPFNHYMYYDSVSDFHKLCSDEFEFKEVRSTYSSIIDTLKKSKSIPLSEIYGDQITFNMDEVCDKVLDFINLKQSDFRPYILIEE